MHQYVGFGQRQSKKELWILGSYIHCTQQTNNLIIADTDNEINNKKITTGLLLLLLLSSCLKITQYESLTVGDKISKIQY